MKETKAFRLGLLGHPVSHSKSPEIFGRFFEESGFNEGEYVLFDLPSMGEFQTLIESEINNDIPLKGFNVTVPYKVDILPYLDHLSAEARAVGAVNTVLVVGKPGSHELHGHNTDVFGFAQSLAQAQLSMQTPISNAIIFGHGGSAKAVQFALRQAHIPFQTWHRNQWITEANNPTNPLEHQQSHSLFINTTPLGMWPNTEGSVTCPWETIGNTHRLIDLVYNPSETTLMKRFADRGAWVMNGAHMLQQQAVAAWTLFRENID